MVFLLALALVLSSPSYAQEKPGRFWIRVLGDSGKIKPAGGTVPLKSSARLRLIVCLQAAQLSDGSEQLGIRAVNQHPDYWKQRPPPNVTLRAERLNGKSAIEAKIRIYSSGSGVDLRTHQVSVDLDILEADSIRQSKLRQIAELFSRAREKYAVSPGVEREAYASRMISYFDELYICNPPGRYRIVAHFQPEGRTIWPLVLDSEPLIIEVADAGDSFEKLKQELAPIR